MPFFRTEDGCSIYYETHGFNRSNPVVVFLNGTLQTTLHWRSNAEALEDRLQVVLYDARGQGQSELGRRSLAVQTHIDDLSDLLRHLDIERTTLLGVSHGAYLALAHTAVSSNSVDGLVLCSLGAVPARRAGLIARTWIELLKASGLEAMVWAALPVVFGEKYLKQHERILPMIVKGITRRNRKEAVIAQLEAMRDYVPASEWAPGVEVPTLVISASDDPLVTEEGAGELSRLCGGRHEHVRGVGHSIPFETPEWFNRTVLE
ncbi:MAG: alpha/beta fold hydrolase, partial [Deltaproteobacteria bacterium]|nr:alpha/beta fold hydrolase [Deltaproteobacteria bacterium]